MKKRTIQGAAGLYARSSNTFTPTKDKNVSARGRENKKVCKRNQGRRVRDIKTRCKREERTALCKTAPTNEQEKAEGRLAGKEDVNGFFRDSAQADL